MTKLNNSQMHALNQLSKAKQLLDNTKKSKRAEFENQLKESVADLLEEVQKRALNADLLGVPRTQIGKSMGTTNYKTVLEVLEAAQAKFGSGAVSSGDIIDDFSVTPLKEGLIITTHAVQHGGSFIVKETDNGFEFSDGDKFAFLSCRDSGLLEEIWQTTKS